MYIVIRICIVVCRLRICVACCCVRRGECPGADDRTISSHCVHVRLTNHPQDGGHQRRWTRRLVACHSPVSLTHAARAVAAERVARIPCHNQANDRAPSGREHGPGATSCLRTAIGGTGHRCTSGRSGLTRTPTSRRRGRTSRRSWRGHTPPRPRRGCTRRAARSTSPARS